VRIVGGKYAGRALTSPADFRVRPTAEHVRAGVLDALAPDLPDASMLDLFAGTGALGLEALSRGAKRCDFVETCPASLHALKANIVIVRMKERSRVFKRDAVPFAAALSEGAYDIVFVDPPYGSKMLDHVITSWQEKKFSRILVCEHERHHSLPNGAKRFDFGETVVSVYRLPGGRPGDKSLAKTAAVAASVAATGAATTAEPAADPAARPVAQDQKKL
jgi:16S rRNA (guanine966-N2)-methyltransferase